jgi:hypothetical protein
VGQCALRGQAPAVGQHARLDARHGFLFVPRGTPHTFRNAGDGEGRIVGTFNPPHFANYFRELAAIINGSGHSPDRQVWTELYARYDTTFYDGG